MEAVVLGLVVLMEIQAPMAAVQALDRASKVQQVRAQTKAADRRSRLPRLAAEAGQETGLSAVMGQAAQEGRGATVLPHRSPVHQSLMDAAAAEVELEPEARLDAQGARQARLADQHRHPRQQTPETAAAVLGGRLLVERLLVAHLLPVW